MPSSRLSSTPTQGQPVNVDKVVDLLAPALGREKSHEAIIASASALGFRLDRLTFAQARGILDKLGAEAGIVGVAARFALTRLIPAKRSSDKFKVVPLLSAQPERAPTDGVEPLASEKTVTQEDVAMLLAHSLGIEKAKEAVGMAVAELVIASELLNLPQAQAILDQIASTPGIVGVTARFAKARLILRFGG